MASASEQTVKLTVRNDVAELASVRETVDRVGTEARMPTKTVMQLQVVLDEVLSNVIKYAWPDGGSHEFFVSINVREGGVEITVTDDGRPFNPLEQALPKPAPPGRRPVPGGVGIHLVGQLVDEFEYVRLGAHNRVTLTKQYKMDLQGENNGK